MLSVPLLIAFLGGVLPSLLWLFFWLMEDSRNPEPKRYIILCFLVGMVFVIPWSADGAYGFVLPLEHLTAGYFSGPLLLLSWATIEEIAKFLAAYLVALHTRASDEPLDAVVYMVTAALGFSAAENILFLLGPISQGDIAQTILTGDLRFIGATLLHTLASATVGIALAVSFFKKPAVRRMYAFAGVVLAIALHTAFNFFILGSGSSATFWIFFCIWFGIVGILLTLERIKNPSIVRV